jgi:hypothetical protein
MLRILPPFLDSRGSHQTESLADFCGLWYNQILLPERLVTTQPQSLGGSRLGYRSRFIIYVLIHNLEHRPRFNNFFQPTIKPFQLIFANRSLYSYLNMGIAR